MSEKEFQPVDDPQEQLSFLKEATLTASSAMIWTRNQGVVVQTQVRDVFSNERLLTCHIPKDFDPKTLAGELAQMGTKECYFSLSLLRANVFFRADFLGYDAQGFRFKWPEAIYKVQRRKFLRLPISGEVSMEASFEDPAIPSQLLRKRLFDLGAGGLGFFIAEREVPVFAPGLILKRLSFAVKGRIIETEAEIRYVRPGEGGLGDDRRKVGVQFVQMKEADSQVIAAYVFDESRKLFSRFLTEKPDGS